MKKLLGFLILLSVMGLAACGDDSASDSAKDDCTEDPALCEDKTPDPEPEE